MPQGGVQRQTSSTLQGRKSSASRKACSSVVRRTSRVARCPFLATCVRTATVLVETSQQSHSPSAKVNSSTIPARIQYIVKVSGLVGVTLECRRKVEHRDQPITIQKKRNMKPATIQPTYHTCAIDCRRSTEYQFDVLPNSSSRSILRLAFDESSARRILSKLHSD